MVYSSFLVFFSRSYLQAFRRAGMPQPLDVWRWDSVGCAVKCLSAPSWHWTRVLQRHCFLPYLRTHCQMRKPTNTQAHAHTHTRAKFNHWGELKTDRNGLMGGELNRSFSPLTTSLSVRFWKSPCSWIRTRTVYLPASSSATSRITREFPSMWYLEHCSAATLPSFNLSEEKKKRTLSKVWWGESK